MAVKKSDIEMHQDQGTFQISIGNECVTESAYKTKDDCYKAYIVELIRSIEKARSSLTNNTGAY